MRLPCDMKRTVEEDSVSRHPIKVSSSSYSLKPVLGLRQNLLIV